MIGNEVENQAVFNTKLTNPKPTEWNSLITELETSTLSALVKGNVELNWESFKSNYQLVEAAGGLVRNPSGEILFIHRNGMWDLPKGKLEEEESIENCAVREVAEECGIEEPTILRPLRTTYHTYQLKGKRILKPTYWFLMKSSDESLLIPQTEEGITEVKWVSEKDATHLLTRSFGSIRDVVGEVL